MTVNWVFFLRVKQYDDCYKLLSRIYGLKFNNIDGKIYWKDESLYRVTAQTELNSTDGKDALWEIHNLLRCIASQFTFNLNFNTDLSGFAGHSTKCKVVGIESVDFEINE